MRSERALCERLSRGGDRPRPADGERLRAGGHGRRLGSSGGVAGVGAQAADRDLPLLDTSGEPAAGSEMDDPASRVDRTCGERIVDAGEALHRGVRQRLADVLRVASLAAKARPVWKWNVPAG